VPLGPFWKIRRLGPTTKKIKGINKEKKNGGRKNKKRGKKLKM